MKIVLSDRIYCKLPEGELGERIKQRFIHSLFTSPGKPPRYIYRFGHIAKGTYWFPIGSLPILEEEGLEVSEIVDKRLEVPVEIPEPTFTLREDQKEVLDQVSSNCVIAAQPGWGKSLMGLAIAHKLKQKTLIICTTTIIRDMWIAEIRKWFGFEPGVIGSGKYNIEPPIVVGNIQTLSKHTNKLISQFGTVISDECFDGRTNVTLADGTVKPIRTIVNQKLEVEVMSYNFSTGVWEPKKVVNWYKNPQKEPILKIKSGQSVMRCTKNHSIYVYKKGDVVKVRADQVVPGDYLTALPSHKTSPVLREESIGLAIALVLGDGNLGYPHKKSRSVRLRVTHGEDQWDYLDYKGRILGNTKKVIGKSGYGTKKVAYIESKSFIDSVGLMEGLYGAGTKKCRIGDNILPFVDWVTWAFLFMDDGTASGSISLCELPVEDIKKLALTKFSEEDFRISTCSKGYNYLNLRKSGMEKLVKNAGKYIHPQLRYKFKNYTLPAFEEIPEDSLLRSDIAIKKIDSIEEDYAEYGYRFNIEVEDNHNYVASGNLVANCHHCPASTFTKLLDLSRAKYKIGLSGTLKRKDGLEVTFPGFFSPQIISPDVNNIMPITVHRYNTDIKLPGNMLTPWALRVNDLYALNSYYRLIQLLTNAYREIGHKVLVVADRVELLNNLYEEDSGAKYIITGQKDHAGLEYRNETMANISKSAVPTTLYASTSIFSEGVSLNELSCIIVCNPTNNESLIKQLAGRVMRIVEGKLDPIYVELVLKGDTGKKHQAQRSGFFASWDWKVVNMDSSGLLEYKRQLTES